MNIAIASDHGGWELKEKLIKYYHKKGINLIDAGHFSTENVICKKLCDKLSKQFTEVETKIADCNVVPMLHFKTEEA